MYLYSKRIYTPQGYKEGYLEVENGRIKKIHQEIDGEYIDYGERVIVPGFIDIHIHGWATGSFIHERSEESLEKMSKELVKVGVTSYLPSTGADALDTIKGQLREGKKAIENYKPDKGADILGFHLEGPFINKEYKGMQKEEYCLDPSIDILEEFFQVGGKENIKLITLAPELEGSLEFIKYVNKEGIQISVGHSAAEFEDIRDLKDYGLGGVVHTYSGMRGFHHRRLGVVGAVMYFDDLYAEFAKQTGMTVKPEAFAIMYRIKGPEKIILTSDSTGLAHVKEPFHHYIRECTFTPDGDYLRLVYDDGREERLYKYDYDKVKDLELSYIDSVKNVVTNVDASIGDIVKMTAENPAKYINIYHKKGSIEAGKDADLLIIDGLWNIEDVYVKGVKQEI